MCGSLPCLCEAYEPPMAMHLLLTACIRLTFKAFVILGLVGVMLLSYYEGKSNEIFEVFHLSDRMEAGRKYQPLRDIPYKTSGSNSDRAVFVVPRRVYYDNRLEAGKPRNTVIILAEVHDDARGTILACELDGNLSKSSKILEESTTWVRSVYPEYVHLAIVIQCMGLPQDAIFNGSIAKLIYRKKGEGYYSRVVSEQPLLLHEGSRDPSTPTKGRGSIVVCTTMYGHPDKFDQWVMYHKYLGVDQVHVNAYISFSKGAVLSYPFFNKSLSNGFVLMEVWKPIIGNRATFHNQMLKYQDCLYRHIGVFQYGLFYDYDDFFNPIIPDQKDIHFYFSEFFSNDSGSFFSKLFSNGVGTVCMPWRQMKCRPTEELVKDVPHGNLTSILSGVQSELRGETKCAHQLNAPLMVSVHTVQTLLPNYRMVNSPEKLAYVAHNRYDAEQCGTP